LDSITDSVNELPGNSSVNTVKHGRVEEALFSVDPTDAPVDCLDNDHVIYIYCRSLSVRGLYKKGTEFVQGSYELRVIVTAEARRLEDSSKVE
jgi:hypothetical protein